MNPNESIRARSPSDPWEGEPERPVSERWKALARRLRPLCAKRFQMVLIYLDQDGEPDHFRVIGKREEI